MSTSVATASALAAFTLFMILALCNVGTTVAAPHGQLASAISAQTQG